MNISKKSTATLFKIKSIPFKNHTLDKEIVRENLLDIMSAQKVIYTAQRPVKLDTVFKTDYTKPGILKIIDNYKTVDQQNYKTGKINTVIIEKR